VIEMANSSTREIVLAPKSGKLSDRLREEASRQSGPIAALLNEAADELLSLEAQLEYAGYND
jgi:hypothetical protein